MYLSRTNVCYLAKNSAVYIHMFYDCTTISEVNLSAFIYRVFHEDFSSMVIFNTELY